MAHTEKHASAHGTGQPDAISPASIGASASGHSHAHGDLTGVSSDQHHAQVHDLNGTDHNGIGGVTRDNFVSFTAAGKLQDSGKSGSSFQGAEANVKFTSDGGLAVKMVAGEDLYAGEVVTVIQVGGGGSADNTVMKTPTSGNELSMPIGAVLADASSSSDVWVVVAGKAKVLPEAGITAARGNVIFTSDGTAGRVEQSATIPVSEHWREVGHFVASGSGAGVATLAMLHFN